MFNDILKPTLQRNFTKKIYGFDIETYDKNKKFYCASIFSNDLQKTFFDKYKLIKYFKKSVFKNSFIAATNLQFDFMGTFFNTDDINKFFMQWRGSDMIFARTYLQNKNFYRKRESNSMKTLTFIDTLNYAKLSVENMGKIINIPKLDKPLCLGRLPKNSYEKKQLITYNLRDSEISYNFTKFLMSSFSDLGATPKLTIASTSMSLYKNKYLNSEYLRHKVDDLLEQLKGYYGGRCEAFSRGEIKNYNYYDFNSLYPSVMLNEFPNPNTLRVCHQNDLSYIESYDGISDVDIYCPYMKYPLLCYRTNNKLLFPYGNFRGWFTHIELKEAIKLGYVIKKVWKTFYYKENCIPFYNFVIDLYNKRKELKADNNAMEKVVKIILNSLYGKFGQKFIDRDNWIPLPDTLEELDKYDDFERIGNFIRVKQKFTYPRSFCIPIWALYVTAYGRLKLYDVLLRSEAVYCDTDSIITKKEYADNSEIGKLKLEMPIKYGIIVKPKFYALVDKDNNEYVKIKGLGTRLCYDEFTKLLINPSKTYNKFMKFKESMRRGFIPNEIQSITKNMSLEDDKRIWNSTFNFRELQDSKPLEIIGGKSEIEIAKKLIS